jgi:glutamate synthase domain-containing protein 1/glutamate synthase domain-containing protein 3
MPNAMTKRHTVENILRSRRDLRPAHFDLHAGRNEAAEGGCGVIGIACSEQIAGRHLLQSLAQMRNRGNGKGGGVAAVGLVPEEFGVSREVLENDYLLAVAYLDPTCRDEVEQQHITPTFEIDHIRAAPHLDDPRALDGLNVSPPTVVQYFVRVKPDVFKTFKSEHDVAGLTWRQIEDEIVYQNSFRLNTAFYSSEGETRAFMLSHGKNLLVVKMVGYGDDVVRYYQLEDVHAHVWIGHHRYPTKGRVWHPGGAHPFVGLNEALVHNGDFANYASIGEYLAQRNIYPLFLTDTEVSVQVFDLLYRTYGYPLEYVIETLAPTTERDFAILPPDKQRIYDMLQVTHMHASPDGPWFFLIAQSDQENDDPVYRLTGITDTSMLRPQVFAWQQAGDDGPAIGFAASEKQGIDAALDSLAAEDGRFWSRADRYWNARGGSHTDGGAFMFSAYPDGNGAARLVCTDKFGRHITSDTARPPYRPNGHQPSPVQLPEGTAWELFASAVEQMPGWDYDAVQDWLHTLASTATTDAGRTRAINVLTLLLDRHYPTGNMRRSSLLTLVDAALDRLWDVIRAEPSAGYAFSSAAQPWQGTARPEQTVVIDARSFAPEGPDSVALEVVRLVKARFRHVIVIHARGHRFIGNGFGSDTSDLVIDVYGSSGDYLGSGIDGMTIRVHGSGQDQLAQIMKAGTLVVHGDVGQTFMYGAKGGAAYVLGNAAGRPLINAVGKPRVVINGTCLDYLAESFMAGDPHNNGGFVILNGIALGDDGELADLDTPYPGGNLFSLASGGAIFVRDPHQHVTPDQLNGGTFAAFTDRDWALIEPYLAENARQFGISIDALLTVDGMRRDPADVYRTIMPSSMRALQAEEAWVQQH